MALIDTRRRGAAGPSRDRLQRVMRSGQGGAAAAATPAGEASFAERVVRPIFMRMTNVSNLFASKSQKEATRELLMQAGFPGGLQTQQVITAKYFFTLAMPLLLMVVCFLVGSLFKWHVELAIYLIAALIGFMIGFLGPTMYLRSLVKKRKKQILLTLPDLIDLLAVSVEAGLGMEQAINKVASRFRGPLRDEMERLSQEVAMGRPRAEAMREMARRVDVPDLTDFITSLIQAEQLGVSVGNVLRVQSEQMRERRSQRAREQAQKAPVKMMIPLVLFIFPTLFIVIMGPAAISGFKSLKASGLF